jgi:hypothetical protein
MDRAMMRLRALSLPVLAAGAAIMTATPAAAWWRGGVWVGVPPVVVAPPVYPYPYYPYPYYPYYAPPPAYYYPPPAATPVPQKQSSVGPVTYGAICHAGVYSCAAPAKTPIGDGCSCPGLGAPSFGVVN